MEKRWVIVWVIQVLYLRIQHQFKPRRRPQQWFTRIWTQDCKEFKPRQPPVWMSTLIWDIILHLLPQPLLLSIHTQDIHRHQSIRWVFHSNQFLFYSFFTNNFQYCCHTSFISVSYLSQKSNLYKNSFINLFNQNSISGAQFAMTGSSFSIFHVFNNA